MRKTLLLAALTVGLASPAKALPVSEDIQLAALVTQAVATGQTLTQVLTTARRSFQVGVETLAVIRKGAEAYRAIENAFKNPQAIFEEGAGLWGASFPEIAAIQREAKLLRTAFRGPSGEYSLGKISEFFGAAGDLPASSVQVFKEMDAAHFGLSGSHMISAKNLALAEEGAATFRQLLRGGKASLTQKEYIARTAIAAADTAQATIGNARRLEELVHMQNIEYAKTKQAEAAGISYRKRRREALGGLLGSTSSEPVEQP